MERVNADPYKSDQLFCIPDNIVWKKLGSGIILLNLQTSNYFTLNDIGDTIWLSITEKKRFCEIMEDILNKYEGDRNEIECSVVEFIQGLLDENILVLSQ